MRFNRTVWREIDGRITLKKSNGIWFKSHFLLIKNDSRRRLGYAFKTDWMSVLPITNK